MVLIQASNVVWMEAHAIPSQAAALSKHHKPHYCLLWYYSQHFGIISVGPLGKTAFDTLHFAVTVNLYSE